MKKVAIFGSCVSRDAFELVPSPDFTVASYVARTSLPSLFSPPMKIEIEEISAANSFEARCIHGDLTKRSLSIFDSDAEVFIVDLIEERFDLIDLAGCLALKTGNLEKSGVLSRFPEAKTLKRLSNETATLWLESSKKFADLVRYGQKRQSKKFILHKAWHAEQYADGETPGLQHAFGPPLDLFPRLHNPLLETYYNQLTSLIAFDAVVELPRQLIVADSAHRWKLFPFHYVAGYYISFMERLRQVAL